MKELVRFGVSIDGPLLQEFDRKIVKHGHTNRSEAIRDLIRDRLVELQWEEPKQEVMASVTLVYDRRRSALPKRLIELQQNHHSQVLVATQVHLDPRHELNVIILRGRADEVRSLADSLLATKGVYHGKLALTTTGKGFGKR